MMLLALLLSTFEASAACPELATTRRHLVVEGAEVSLRDGQAEAAVQECSEEVQEAVSRWADMRRCTLISGVTGIILWPALGVTLWCALEEKEQREALGAAGQG